MAKSEFDATKDQQLEEFIMEDGSMRFKAIVYSYDGGEPKVQFKRSLIRKNGHEQFINVGRLRKEEVVFLKENVDYILMAMEDK